jgi:hypothetical protein
MLAPVSYASWLAVRGYVRRPAMPGDAEVTRPTKVRPGQVFVLEAPAAAVSPTVGSSSFAAAGASEFETQEERPRKRRR